ncbi:intraflagellar transport protein 46 homolog [Tribolium castaneum]|uniref:Intraflagellar transport protein 46 homolog n=1 Tax=Tribolium castaneum TaxID=7070 RepID=D6X3W9_TRICA|nr:PREDICTED: intraflagellar transport protein 46 homolog [Tribolium castaneum]EEZ97358.1 Intraflagellar transport protein 46 homolog-like Protein [Tribolium castaneum]|eukprot:XP_008198714.2 PREDICTED: intraflagellar transport protein 46 homolog [Tribolium castaneum]
MQRSFSIVDDEEESENFDEQILKKYGGALSERSNSQTINDYETNLAKMATRQASATDYDPDKHLSKIPSAGPSGRQTVLRKPTGLSSDSEDDSDEEKTKDAIPGEYDPKEYENLDVSPEIKDIFQYITKYIPQQMGLDHKFKPFVPEFLPAVGDIDAFLKVLPPKTLLSDADFVANQQLGLVVLDEPAANQSDPALLHLQLRAESVKTTNDSTVVVKKIDNVEKNAKIIDKWIKDISALHKSKSFPAVRYTEPMPDLDELMQEWPESMEKQLSENGFPEPKGNLSDYVQEVCGLFQIPVKNKIQALHLLFSLFAAVKSSQLFKNGQLGKVEESESIGNVADQLVLD